MAIFRWARRLPPEALLQFGLTQAGCHATYHDFFKALDVVATQQVLGIWARGDAPLGHGAIDGKRLRGSIDKGYGRIERRELATLCNTILRLLPRDNQGENARHSG